MALCNHQMSERKLAIVPAIHLFAYARWTNHCNQWQLRPNLDQRELSPIAKTEASPLQTSRRSVQEYTTCSLTTSLYYPIRLPQNVRNLLPDCAMFLYKICRVFPAYLANFFLSKNLLVRRLMLVKHYRILFK